MLLFGSYANGTATDDSDIDIAVVVDFVDDDVLTEKARLYQLRRNINDRIEPVLIEDGDDPSGFLQYILNNGQVIFESG
ncbi:nucleotidyltransferase domain-containing protein [Salicibibacter cibarius]|uniref:nucleotidyltransferase domain-containing protein n=1 Tax=Salicibibacter cibarius TaxID=2743000 RepID=UPI001908D973